jgi:exonuclease III
MNKAGFVDAYKKNPVPTASHGQRLDYVWVTDGVLVKETMVTEAEVWDIQDIEVRRREAVSDHAGLIVELVIS